MRKWALEWLEGFNFFIISIKWWWVLLLYYYMMTVLFLLGSEKKGFISVVRCVMDLIIMAFTTQTDSSIFIGRLGLFFTSH